MSLKMSRSRHTRSVAPFVADPASAYTSPKSHALVIPRESISRNARPNASRRAVSDGGGTARVTRGIALSRNSPVGRFVPPEPSRSTTPPGGSRDGSVRSAAPARRIAPALATPACASARRSQTAASASMPYASSANHDASGRAPPHRVSSHPPPMIQSSGEARLRRRGDGAKDSSLLETRERSSCARRNPPDTRCACASRDLGTRRHRRSRTQRRRRRPRMSARDSSSVRSRPRRASRRGGCRRLKRARRPSPPSPRPKAQWRRRCICVRP